MIGINSAIAQKDVSQSEAYPFGIGPFFLFKGGVNASDVPEGIKNGFNFNGIPDIGAAFYIPFTKENNLALEVDLAYSRYTYELKKTGDEDNPWSNEFGFITLGPSLHLYGFLLGFEFGMPIHAGSDEDAFDYSVNDIGFSAVVRIGAMIPVYADEFGRLNIDIRGAYFLTGLFSDVPESWDDYNPHPASLAIGMSYIFNITPNK